MKKKEYVDAIQMRKNGMALGEIASTLNVAKSTVSYWVRDVPLSTKNRRALKARSFTRSAIEKRRQARIAGTNKKRELIKQLANKEVVDMIKLPLWCIGVSLYWGEGGKTQQTARLSNSDPSIVKIMMRFFLEVCRVDKSKIRGHVHTYSHLNANAAERYWSKVSGIPREKMYKTYVKKSVASKDKRDTLPYGTFQIYVHDSDFFFRLMAWIEALKLKLHD